LRDLENESKEGEERVHVHVEMEATKEEIRSMLQKTKAEIEMTVR